MVEHHSPDTTTSCVLRGVHRFDLEVVVAGSSQCADGKEVVATTARVQVDVNGDEHLRGHRENVTKGVWLRANST